MSVPASGTLLRSAVRRYLDSQLLLLESFVPDKLNNHSPHGSQYGIVNPDFRGSTVLYVFTVLVFWALPFGDAFDWQIVMDKYLSFHSTIA